MHFSEFMRNCYLQSLGHAHSIGSCLLSLCLKSSSTFVAMYRGFLQTIMIVYSLTFLFFLRIILICITITGDDNERWITQSKTDNQDCTQIEVGTVGR